MCAFAEGRMPALLSTAKTLCSTQGDGHRGPNGHLWLRYALANYADLVAGLSMFRCNREFILRNNVSRSGTTQSASARIA